MCYCAVFKFNFRDTLSGVTIKLIETEDNCANEKRSAFCTGDYHILIMHAVGKCENKINSACCTESHYRYNNKNGQTGIQPIITTNTAVIVPNAPAQS